MACLSKVVDHNFLLKVLNIDRPNTCDAIGHIIAGVLISSLDNG